MENKMKKKFTWNGKQNEKNSKRTPRTAEFNGNGTEH